MVSMSCTCVWTILPNDSVGRRGAEAYGGAFLEAVEAGAVEDATTPRAFALLGAAVRHAKPFQSACERHTARGATAESWGASTGGTHGAGSVSEQGARTQVQWEIYNCQRT